MLGSVDSTSFVLTYPNLRPEAIVELGFAKKKDSFGSWTWFDNGMREIYEPQLTFYRTWNRMFRLRVDINFAKLFHGILKTRQINCLFQIIRFMKDQLDVALTCQIEIVITY